MALGANIFPNGGFETVSSGDVLTDWYVSNASVVRDGTYKRSGTYSCRLPYNQYISKDLRGTGDGLVPGRDVTVTIYLFDAVVCPSWVNGSDYTVGQEVRGSNGKDYKCKTALGSGSDDPAGASQTHWTAVGIIMGITGSASSVAGNTIGGYSTDLTNVTSANIAGSQWQALSLTFRIPPNCTYVKTTITNTYVSKTAIWLDDFTFVHIDANQFNAWIDLPNNELTPDMDGLFNVSWEVNTTEALKTAGVTRVRIAIPGITDILKVTTSTYGGIQTQQVDVSSLAAGSYTITLTHEKTADSTPYNVVTCVLRKLSSNKTRTYVDKFRRLVINGKPTFLNGLYGGLPVAADIAHMATSGFNAFIDYNIASDWGEVTGDNQGANAKARIKALYDAGIYSIVSLKDWKTGSMYANNFHGGGTPGVAATTQEALNAMAYFVTTLKDCDGVIGWYANDELEGGAELDAIYALIHSLDDKPVFQTTYAMHSIQSILSSSDCIGVDHYTKYLSFSALSFASQMANLTTDTAEKGYRYAVPECGSVDESSAAPTTAEMLTNAYSALAAGVGGIIWYTLGVGGTTTYGILKGGTPQWDICTAAIASHLVKLTGIVNGVYAPYQVTSSGGTGGANLKLITRLWNGEPWVIAVNPTAATITGHTLTVDAAYGVDRASLGLPGDTPTATYTVTGGTTFTPADVLAGGVACYRLYVNSPLAIPAKKNVHDNIIWNSSNIKLGIL